MEERSRREINNTAQLKGGRIREYEYMSDLGWGTVADTTERWRTPLNGGGHY
jgi:hypothetical protein